MSYRFMTELLMDYLDSAFTYIKERLKDCFSITHTKERLKGFFECTFLVHLMERVKNYFSPDQVDISSSERNPILKAVADDERKASLKMIACEVMELTSPDREVCLFMFVQ